MKLDSPVIKILTMLGILVGLGFAAAAASAADPQPPPAAGSTCRLGNRDGQVKHVIYLQFDNTHFNRDRRNVASDLEQMPHLLHALTSQGTLFTNDHTILISHTAGGILSSLTGLYPDRNGQTVSNGYDYFAANGKPKFTSSFKYWTNPVDPTGNPLPNMITDGRKNTPAPWVPYTRAGCDVGGVGMANIELENNSTSPSGDITRVFGVGSPEYVEAANPVTHDKSQTDLVGIAVHCAQTGGVCAANPNAKPDPLRDEPGGYPGFKALFGAKSVNPAVTGGPACVRDTAGQPVTDPAGNCGFPGFDALSAKNTLGYVAQMQEAGVPVTYGYISDAHDNHVLDRPSGPGEADYKAQLKAYDDAFAAFFQRLQQDGINRSNTLFVATVDEGDHFAGGVGIPRPDGSLAYTHVPCTNLTACPSNNVGEVNANIKGLLPAGEPGFDIHFDAAPAFYVNGQPSRTDPAVRKLERDTAALTATDPYVHGTVALTQRLADPVEEQALHMVNADPSRTPTFTMFANPDFYFQTVAPNCGANPCVNPDHAWIHGDFQNEIANTWVGITGPGVRNRRIDSRVWTDHTNVRPTMLALLGLRDDYTHDGHVLVEALNTRATPLSLIIHGGSVRRLGAVYEQLNAPFGIFDLRTLEASTTALKSTDSATYDRIEGQIASLTALRDALAKQIKAQLDGAAFAGRLLNPRDAENEVRQAVSLIEQAVRLASS